MIIIIMKITQYSFVPFSHFNYVTVFFSVRNNLIKLNPKINVIFFSLAIHKSTNNVKINITYSFLAINLCLSRNFIKIYVLFAYSYLMLTNIVLSYQLINNFRKRKCSVTRFSIPIKFYLSSFNLVVEFVFIIYN